jgi:hypothetical protein
MSIQLAPDVEAGLRAEAEARGVTVDTLVAAAVDSYLAKASRPTQNDDRSAEMRWSENPPSDYHGQWVALEGGNVVAAGSQAKVVYNSARETGISSPFVIFVPREEQEPFTGGWPD